MRVMVAAVRRSDEAIFAAIRDLRVDNAAAPLLFATVQRSFAPSQRENAAFRSCSDGCVGCLRFVARPKKPHKPAMRSCIRASRVRKQQMQTGKFTPRRAT
jgi:hypothetical protein